MHIETINPSTGEIITRYPLHNNSDVTTIINDTHEAYLKWQNISFDERSNLMFSLVNLMLKNKHEYAELMACEMGKPINIGVMEVEKCAKVCEYFGSNAKDFLASREIHVEVGKRFVYHKPRGIVFAIMPWNFPFWQVFRFAAPTIMSGNAAILKHAPISTGTGKAIVDLFIKAGFPKNLFNQVIVDNEGAAFVIANDKVIAVTLTGSERAGREVAGAAGRYLKKCVLELGGNDPYIVLSDADLDLAAKLLVNYRIANTGQVCIAPKRIIVLNDVKDALVEKILGYIKLHVMGSPLDLKTTFGPMARQDLRDTLHTQVLDTIASGAKLILGGVIPEGKGFYYPPTVLTDVKPKMRAFEEELFGPVFSIITANSEEEAIMLANDTKYGLGAGIFTRDIKKGEDIAINRIEAGTCCVNAIVGSDPRVPFGGIKASGFGRELSKEGILEFVNVKGVGIG